MRRNQGHYQSWTTIIVLTIIVIIIIITATAITIVIVVVVVYLVVPIITIIMDAITPNWRLHFSQGHL